MKPFTIEARERSSGARAGLLHTAHGTVRTPAFVPLATKATVKGMLPEEVAGLGYEMVLGNTFHLMINPGAELIQSLGGLHRFMGWEGPIITDSGGFQVFSMGHGRVADEIKGSRRSASRPDADNGAGAQTDDHGEDDGAPEGAVLSIEEEGVRFRSYFDGRELWLTPERSMEVQAALGSDIALVFDECTPFHVERPYTEGSTERTHRWLRRCLDWHAERGPSAQLVYGIVQGGVYEDLRRDSAREVATSGCDGVAIGGSLGETKPQMYEVVRYALAELDGDHEELPRHLLGIGELDDLVSGVELGIDTFDCAMPTRLARHGSALVSDADEPRSRIDLMRGRWREDCRPLQAGCSCPACSRGLTRAYLSYLARSRELTAARLLSAHNLAFLARLMRELRAAIAEDRLAEVSARWRAGAGFGRRAEHVA
jgi:queuine tRNA-ribosyltransferase